MLCYCSAPGGYWPNAKAFVFYTWHGRVISACFLIHVNMMFTLVSLLPTHKTRNCIYMSASLGDVICLTILVTLACDTHATLISKEIVTFLNVVVLCPRCGRQTLLIVTRVIPSVAVVMRSLKSCFTSSIFASSVIPSPHTTVVRHRFADVAPLDGY